MWLIMLLAIKKSMAPIVKLFTTLLKNTEESS